MNEQVNLFDVDGLSADSFNTNAFARPFWFVHRREGLFISLQCVADGHDTFGPFADPDTAATIRPQTWNFTDRPSRR
jgi:hypothetical protein